LIHREHRTAEFGKLCWLTEKVDGVNQSGPSFVRNAGLSSDTATVWRHWPARITWSHSDHYCSLRTVSTT